MAVLLMMYEVTGHVTRPTSRWFDGFTGIADEKSKRFPVAALAEVPGDESGDCHAGTVPGRTKAGHKHGR
jgi:hypothetical protein